MFCPACGTQLPESAKFCLECGVKLASFAPGIAPPVNVTPVVSPAGSGTLHGTGAAPVATPDAVRPSKTGTTAHGAQVYVDPGDDRVVVPMSGPSRKTLVAGAIGIAVVSLSIGAVGAWRAVKASRVEVAPSVPITPETTVALLELPQALPHSATAGTASANTGAHNGARGTSASGAARGSNGANTTAGAANPGSNPAQAGGNSANTGAPTANAGGQSANSGVPHANSGGRTANSGVPNANSGGRTANAGSTTANAGGNTANTGAATANSGGNSAAGSGATGASGGGEGPGLAGPRAPAQNGFVEGDETDATGTLSPSAFRFVYTHYRSQIASCQSSVTRGGQEVRGIIRVRVRIGTDGHVLRTRVMENTTRNDNLATCVQNQIRTWRYPAPEGGEVEVDYPLGFGN